MAGFLVVFSVCPFLPLVLAGGRSWVECQRIMAWNLVVPVSSTQPSSGGCWKEGGGRWWSRVFGTLLGFEESHSSLPPRRRVGSLTPLVVVWAGGLITG